MAQIALEAPRFGQCPPFIPKAHRDCQVKFEEEFRRANRPNGCGRRSSSAPARSCRQQPPALALGLCLGLIRVRDIPNQTTIGVTVHELGCRRRVVVPTVPDVAELVATS